MPERKSKVAAARADATGDASDADMAGVWPVPAGEAQPQALRLDESMLAADYTNFVRVSGTAEEVILDLGLNKQSHKGQAGPSEAVTVHRRVVVSYYTAKRLLHAISMAVQRHEANFGRLETDVQSRLRKQRPASA